MTYKPKTWKRKTEDTDLGIVEQFIHCDEAGEITAWEEYEDGVTSAKVALDRKTFLIPVGYIEVEE